MKYFKLSDFDCQETGENEMNEDFLIKLDDLRHECGFPFIVTSGYRSSTHSIEAKKVKAGSKAGTHAQGIAADIRIHSGAEGFVIVSKAIKMGFRGIGVAKTFIHLDVRKTMPVIWSY
jgi:zinc D-Ala-D-Ala carboxypeptidase